MKNKEAYEKYILDFFSRSDEAEICDFKKSKVFHLNKNAGCGFGCKECEKKTKTWLESEYDEKLEPCPVCGETPEICVFTRDAYCGSDFKDIYKVMCNNLKCGLNIKTGGFYAVQDAKRAWNDSIYKIRQNVVADD